MSDASQTKLSFRDEDVWGETPTDPSPQRAGREFRFTAEGLNFNVETVNSEEIRDDRNISGLVRVGAESAGDVSIESSFGSHDPLLEGAFFENWSPLVDLNNPVTSPLDNVTVTVTASVTSPFADSVGTVSIPLASPDVFANIAVGHFIEISLSGSPNVDGFYLVTANDGAGALSVQPSPTVSTSGTMRVRSSSIQNGTTFKSFLLEKEFRDVGQFFAFTGMRVGTWEQNIAPGSILNGSMSFQGKSVFEAQATVFGTSPAVLPVTATEVLNAVDNIGGILIDGAAPTGINFTEISFTMDNQLRPNPAIGTLEQVQIGAGQVQVSGTMQAYFLNLNLYTLFRNFSTVRLSFVATDIDGNSYVYFFPAFKLTASEVVAGGNNQDVIANFEFTAFRDPTLGFAIGLSRFPEAASTLLPSTADQ